MVEKCDHLTDRFEVVWDDDDHAGENLHRECLRLEDHEGPHLIQIFSGDFVAWEYLCPPNKRCEGCEYEDPKDRCVVFREVGDEVAKKLIKSGTFKGGIKPR